MSKELFMRIPNCDNLPNCNFPNVQYPKRPLPKCSRMYIFRRLQRGPSGAARTG